MLATHLVRHIVWSVQMRQMGRLGLVSEVYYVCHDIPKNGVVPRRDGALESTFLADLFASGLDSSLICPLGLIHV